MKIRVLFFAGLREIFGPHRVVEAADGLSVAELVGQLTASSEEFASKAWPLVYAVSETFETPDKKLADGDHLAVMMPLSGG